MRRLIEWFLNIIRFLTTKEYIPQYSPGHVKRAKKEQRFYSALPPGCLLVYAFSVTTWSKSFSFYYITAYILSQLAATLRLECRTHLTIFWVLPVCAWATPSLNRKITGDKYIGIGGSFYTCFNCFGPIPLAKFVHPVLLKFYWVLSLTPSSQIIGFEPIATVSVNVVSFLPSWLYL